jgi:hypothetical protein
VHADGKQRPEWLQRMHHLHSADYYPQRIGMRDYAELDPIERAKLLTFLTDVLLDQPHILGEIEHRVQQGRLHAGKGGEGGSWPSVEYTPEQLEKRREDDAQGILEPQPEFTGCMLCLQVRKQNNLPLSKQTVYILNTISLNAVFFFETSCCVLYLLLWLGKSADIAGALCGCGGPRISGVSPIEL